MGQVTDLAVSAILLAGLYATMAYGLGLIYGVLRIVNLNYLERLPRALKPRRFHASPTPTLKHET